MTTTITTEPKAKRITAKQAQQNEALEQLHRILKPGATVYTVLRHVSRSGMMRHIDCYAIVDGEHRYLSGYIATACDYNRTPQGAIKMSGCGMDMGYAIVYGLSRHMFRKGFECSGDNCPSNDHNNDRNCPRGGGYRHTGDGGYALNHKWI